MKPPTARGEWVLARAEVMQLGPQAQVHFQSALGKGSQARSSGHQRRSPNAPQGQAKPSDGHKRFVRSKGNWSRHTQKLVLLHQRQLFR